MRNMTLFDEMYGAEKFDRLAQVMDTVNAKYGSTTLYLAHSQSAEVVELADTPS